MDRPRLGFGLFLVTLLIAPRVPVGGFAASVSISLGAVGLVLWLMLAPRLPVRAVLTMPTILGLIGFSVYAWLISFYSGSLTAVAYGAQYALYAVGGGALIPAYILHSERQGRLAEVWRVVAWVGAIYLGGIIVSLWTGPIYPYQVASGGKIYGSFVIPRGSGFSQSVNAAGGISAVLATFYLFLYRPSGRLSLPLSALGLAGLVATLSRSAVVAFGAAVCVSAVVLALHAILIRGAVRVRLRLPVVPIALLSAAIIAGVVSFQQPIVAAAWQRLLLDREQQTTDVDTRLQIWQGHASAWASKDFADQLTGSGFRSSGLIENSNVYSSAHNVYIEFLIDFGIVGLLIFVGTIMTAWLKALYVVFVQRDNRLAMFCLTGLTVLIVHDMTEDFFYDMVTLTFLILLLTCGELANRKQRLRPQKQGLEAVTAIPQA